MQERQAGITALGTAYARAYHATHETPKIFDDFLADQFFTEEERGYINQNLAGMLKAIDPDLAASNPDEATALGWVMQLIYGPVTLSRSRYMEDSLEEAIKQGVEQYVILGAGFDTFAFRRPDLVTQLQVFEVDHPATQALKRQRIEMPGWEIPAHLYFVPIDFTAQSLADVLLRSSYDPQKLSFFSWQGVTYYLTQEVVYATLKAISSLALRGSAIVFDYMDADAFIPERAARRTQLMHGIARQVGEPMKAGFDPLTLAAELNRLGWSVQENLSPSDIESRYFEGRTDLYHAFEHVHFLRAGIA